MNCWTMEEDRLLLKFYSQVESFKKWKNISDNFYTLGIQKSVYQCRERYVNRLDPSIKNDKWDKQQVVALFCSYKDYGPKWQKMQSVLPQRTQTQMKNKFYSFVRSFLLRTAKNQKIDTNLEIYSIKSKQIKKLYEGTDEFSQFKGRVWKYLDLIDYQITQKIISDLISGHEVQIKQMYARIKKNCRFDKQNANEIGQECQHSIKSQIDKDQQKIKNRAFENQFKFPQQKKQNSDRNHLLESKTKASTATQIEEKIKLETLEVKEIQKIDSPVSGWQNNFCSNSQLGFQQKNPQVYQNIQLMFPYNEQYFNPFNQYFNPCYFFY